MAAAVKSLGYVRVETTDLEKWRHFGSDLCGFQVASESEDHLALRMDNKAFRWWINKGEQDKLTALGFEVATSEDLAELTQKVREAGYDVTVHTPEFARSRSLTEFVSFTDPDGVVDIHLFLGMSDGMTPFASPNGTVFLTGDGGLGHAFQLVGDPAAYRKLYVETLGFKVSDWIDMPLGPPGSGAPEVELNFLHCNPRHHTFAYGQIPNGPRLVGHIMVETTDIDAVGRAYDKVVKDAAAPLVLTFGKHSNDKMLSFYMESPSGFQVEFGTGGLLIDDNTWTPARYNAPQYWGHVRQSGEPPKDPVDRAQAAG
nr:2,3-dihydroxybiphenyl 1,2-dioxygenase [uncultured bacterium]BAH90119.1 2,3-dihydroxybiphenyl-1,2-dioxygenase [uncultured bacterium]